MRLLCSLFVAVGLLVAVSALARGEDEPAAAELSARVDLLGREVRYLRSRESHLSTYVLRNGERAAALERLATELRALGFTSGANPAPARERLLASFTEMAQDLRAELPVPTKAELEMLAALAR